MNAIASLGRRVIERVRGIGTATLLLLQVILSLPTWLGVRLFIYQMYRVGVMSLLIIVVSGLFIGAVLGLIAVMKNLADPSKLGHGIAAAFTATIYGIASANLGRWSLVAWLRGEYTHTRGKGGDISQNYFSLFPNANVSYALTKDGAYSLIAQYARTIERPRFWSLNPQRFQISDYTYQTGNPELDPAYKQDISLTLVLKHKYTLTGGMTIQRDEIQQTIRPDADDPARLCLAWTNFDTTKNYYLTANAPFQFTKWWTMNLNLTYIRQGQRIDEHSAEKHYNFYFVNSSTTFSLPAKFYIDLSYRFQSRMDFGNCWVKPLHFLNAGIKKRFGDKVDVHLVDKIVDGKVYADQGIIAGCSGGTYDNLAEAGAILKGKSIGNDYFTASAYPQSTPVSMAVTREGITADLIEAGVVMKPAFCGPCFGAGDVPSNNGLSIRHTTRNFPNREGSKPGQGQLSLVALMDARSIAATAANGGVITAATDVE